MKTLLDAARNEMQPLVKTILDAASEILTLRQTVRELRQIIRDALPWVDAYELARDKDCTEPAGLLERMRAAVNEGGDR